MHTSTKWFLIHLKSTNNKTWYIWHQGQGYGFQHPLTPREPHIGHHLYTTYWFTIIIVKICKHLWHFTFKHLWQKTKYMADIVHNSHSLKYQMFWQDGISSFVFIVTTLIILYAAVIQCFRVNSVICLLLNLYKLYNYIKT